MIDGKLLIEVLKQRISSHEKDADDFKEYEIKFDMEEIHLRLADECQAIIELVEEQPKIEKCGDCSRRKFYQKGYEDAITDALNGFARPEQELSIMALPLEVLKLDTRSYNCLYYNGCRSVGDCVRMDEQHISRIRNLGKKSADAIARALRQKDIRNTDWDKFLIKEE